MKSTLNKVLVVLTVSALFAGNINAANPRKQRGTTATKRSRQKNAAKVEMSKLDFFQLVENYGSSSFGRWTEEDRKVALEEQYGSLDKAPKNLKLYLIGSDKDKTSAFRGKHKEAALKELAGNSTKEATDNLKDATKELEADPSNPDLQEKVAEQTGLLASMTKTMEQYLSPGTVTVVKAAVGAGALALAAYGATYVVDFAAGKLGTYKEGELMPGEKFRSSVSSGVSSGYEYLSTSGPATWAAAKAKAYLPAAITSRMLAAEAKTDQKVKELTEAEKKAAAAELEVAKKAEAARIAAEQEEAAKNAAGAGETTE